MAQLGTVESIKNNHVFVKVIREEACAHCKVCTTGINEGKECVVEAVNKCDATVGDIVEIDVQANYFLRATAIMYGIPLIALLLGTGISLTALNALEVSNSEVLGAIFGLTFTGITYLLINHREKNNKNNEYLPIATLKRSTKA